MAATLLLDEHEPLEIPADVQSLADARGQQPTLVIHHRGPSAFIPADRDADGFQQSLVFARRFRLDSMWEPAGNWAFDLRS
jgi:hypothetical protein